MYTEIYRKGLLKEIEILQKHKINTVFVGFGGDEMFEIRTKWSTQHRRVNRSDLELVFTNKFFEDLKLNKVKKFKDEFFPESFYESLVSRNLFFTEMGIWPITPYRDYDIYQFFQNFKVNKKEFFRSFYGAIDKNLLDLFSKNTNMVGYFDEFFVSIHFEK